ncbi:MAG: amidohydrolase family protein [Bryobacteraceae bacterium]
MRIERCTWVVAGVGVLVAGLTSASAQSGSQTRAKIFTGARLIDGTGKPAVEKASLLVRDGRVEAVSTPAKAGTGVQVVDLAGKTIIPGLVNAHAHVSDQQGTRSGAEFYTEENVARQLGVYARYGVTTLWSLGGDGPVAVKLRDSQDTPSLARARLYFAGPVITGKTPDLARQMVAKVAAMKPDVIKIRVDDNLGSGQKMTPDVYRAVIDEAHKLGLRVAVHIYYLDDAKSLLKSGADFIAHSVRDRDVDDEFISLMKQRDICYCPTFTRELSTYAYESTPAFFKDPFFRREADPEVIRQLQEPERQAAMRNNKSAQTYKAQLAVAKRNLKKVADAGVRIAMGTDTGAGPGRFQGYFEHVELEMMADAGLTPSQILRAATGDAAKCMDRADRVGTLEPGKWADFIVLDENPLADIRKTRGVRSVWIAGNEVKR